MSSDPFDGGTRFRASGTCGSMPLRIADVPFPIASTGLAAKEALASGKNPRPDGLCRSVYQNFSGRRVVYLTWEEILESLKNWRWRRASSEAGDVLALKHCGLDTGSMNIP